MSADVIELHPEGGAGGVSGACFGITACESKHFFDDLLNLGGDRVLGNVESRATRATYATQAQHWLDALLDDTPAFTPAAPTTPAAPKHWLVSVPGRAPEAVTCLQGATEAEMLAQWPTAHVEPLS